MEFKRSKTDRREAGYNLMELLVGIAIGAMVLAAVGTFFMFSLRSFASMANYTDLNSKDRYATDVMTRDIRNTIQVPSYTTNQIQLTQFGGTNTVTYTYDASLRTIKRVDSSSTKMLLTNVTTCTFALYSRPATNATYDIFPTGDTSNVKLIGYKWSCSRKLYGSMSESESVQMAKVSIRNQ